MHRTLSLKIGYLNSFLICPLCKGYLIDSYTINECLHSFCKSCIIKYIKRKECCPVCKIDIMKDRMNLFLKPDTNLQCIVYKIVPELFKKEMKRRRQFYLTRPKALNFLKKKKIFDKEAIGELDDDDLFVIDKYTDISLSIEYSETGLADVCDSARYKELEPPSPKIYLQCPATLSIQLLKKFISIKFGLENFKKLDIMYDDKPLSKDITLLDISYIYAWRRTAPMRLFYRIIDQHLIDSDKSNQNATIPISIRNDNRKKESIEGPNFKKDHVMETENCISSSFKEHSILNLSSSSQFEHTEKPEAELTPQKENFFDTSLDSYLKIQTDPSTNELILKENLENSNKSPSNIKGFLSSNQTGSSQNLINEESLTITNMVESIKAVPNLSTKLETVSNSDKENEDEYRTKREIFLVTDNENSKSKKLKTVKLKKELNSNEEVTEMTKKKKSQKYGDSNPVKKQKLSQTAEKSSINDHFKKEIHDDEFDNTFPKKLSTHMLSNSNFSNNSQTSPSQLAMLQNFQLMPLMYPWKSLEYSTNFQQGQQIQNQQQTANLSSHALINQKYASHAFDFFQNKTQPYQNFYANQTQNSQQQSLNSHYSCVGQPGFNHFNQYNYMEELKKPLSNFASLIQEATSYQNTVFTPKALQNENSGLDSLKETQIKISESCSLVNE